MTNPSKKAFLGSCVIFLLTLMVYSFVLESPFKTRDDQVSIVHNDLIRNFANTPEILTSSFFGKDAYYRPLVSLSYMLEYHLFGLNPFYYYLDNVFIHIATALLLWTVLYLIFRRGLFAFAVALLFAIHPVQWEAVANISGRAILLSAFFNMGALACFGLAGGRKGFYALAILSFVLALLSKESSGVFPLILFAYVLLTRQENTEGGQGERVSLAWPAVVPFFFVDIFYTIFRRSLGITHVFLWRSVQEALLGFLTFLRGVLTYLRLFIFPMDLHFDRARALFTSLDNPELIATCAFFLLLAGLLMKFRKKIPPEAWFFAAWFVVELIPVSQIVVAIGVQPGTISLAEHFLYLPSVGIFVLMALGFKALYARVNKCGQPQIISRKIFRVIVVGFYVFFAFITVQQNIYASNEITMFERTLAFNPANVRIRTSLALLYAQNQQFAQGERHFRQALTLDPTDAFARVGLGKLLVDQGKFWKGISEYEKVQNPGALEETLSKNLNAAYQALVRKYQAMLEVPTAGEDSEVHYSLGVVYSRMGRFSEAAEHFREAVALKPDYREALFNLGVTYFTLEKFEQGISSFEKLLSLKSPQIAQSDDLDYEAARYLAQIYQNLGDISNAKKYNGDQASGRESVGSKE